MIFRLAFKSLKNRWATSLLAVFSIALGVALYVGVEHVRSGVRESFSNSVSQTDLIVGARGGSLPLLLYTVFRIGNASNNISYKAFEHFRDHPAVDWVIPYSLGDSYRGYRVVATEQSFFDHYRFRGDQGVRFSEGQAFRQTHDVVLGSDVAKSLRHRVGDSIVLAHGVSDDAAVYEHEDQPFRVVGILAPTATPIDRSVYISLAAMEAIHAHWQAGVPPDSQDLHAKNLPMPEIKSITSFLLRAKSRIDALRLQREVADYRSEPLMAIIPGVALSELWGAIGHAEIALKLVSACVILVAILGLLIALLSSLNQRRREMAILRVLGIGRLRMLGLLVLETGLLSFAGILVGLSMTYAFFVLSQGWILETYGFFLPIQGLTMAHITWMGALLTIGLLVGLIPALRAYRASLADGLQIKV